MFRTTKHFLSFNKPNSTLLFRILTSPFSSQHPKHVPKPKQKPKRKPRPIPKLIVIQRPMLKPIPEPIQKPIPIPGPDAALEISRILTDFDKPHHDIEEALSPYSSNISLGLVQDVLKRAENLGFSAHRFFLWARKTPGYEPDFETYRLLVNVLANSKQFPLIWDLLNEMKQCGSEHLNNEIFWVIFDGYCRNELPHDAIRAFDRMREFGVKQNVVDVEKLLGILCGMKFVKHGQGFFDKVKGRFRVGVECFSILVSAWGDIGDFSRARKVFDEMVVREGCVVDVSMYNVLLEVLCKLGEFEEAYGVFRGMESKGLVPDVSSYSIFVGAFCERNDVDSAFRVLDRMRRRNLVPDLSTYNGVIRRLICNKEVDKAYALLEVMVKDGVAPDTKTYCMIMTYHCNLCEVNRAMMLFSRMMTEKGCAPDEPTHNKLLKVLFRMRRFDMVEQVWYSMPKTGFNPGTKTYTVMILGFLEAWMHLEACKFFHIMIHKGIVPYISTVKLLRMRLKQRGLDEKIPFLADKMKASSSLSIRELSTIMRYQTPPPPSQPTVIVEKRDEKNPELSEEEEWPFKAPIRKRRT